MSIEDKRRRLTSTAESTGQLTVAELIARREAETMPIPVITDDITPEAFEDTVKFKPVSTPRKAAQKVKAIAGKEIHITELLRREGRDDDTQRSGFTVGKLAAAASGGVVLCGSMAFGASSLLSSPDERPLAEVRFDERAQARGASTGTEGVVKLPSNKTQTADPTTEETTEQTTAPRVAPYTQQQQKPKQTQTQQQPTQAQQPTSETQAPSTPSSSGTTTPSPSTPPTSDAPPPPTSTSGTPPSSSTPPSSQNPLPTPSNPVDVSVDLGILDPILEPLGNFDFFGAAN